jgi:hypothetical protein
LAEEFAGAKGLSIRYMIVALQELKYISFGDRQKTKVVDALNELFGANIGSRQSIFTVNLDDKTIREQYEPSIRASKRKIQSLIEQIGI